MSIVTMLAQHADVTMQSIHMAGSMISDAALHGKHAADHAGNDLLQLAQATTTAPADAGSSGITVDQFKERLQNVQQEEQLGWLASIGKHFIGVFQKVAKFLLGL